MLFGVGFVGLVCFFCLEGRLLVWSFPACLSS